MDSLLLGRGVYKVEPVIPDPLFTGDSANVVLDTGAIATLVNVDGTQPDFTQSTPSSRPTVDAGGGILFGTNSRLVQTSNVVTPLPAFTYCFWAYLPSPFTIVGGDNYACFFTDYVGAPTYGIWISVRDLAPAQKGFNLVLGAQGAVLSRFVGIDNATLWDSTYLDRWTFISVTVSGTKVKFGANTTFYGYTSPSNGVEIGNSGLANIGSFGAARYLPSGTKMEAVSFKPYAMSATELYLKRQQDLIDYPYLST